MDVLLVSVLVPVVIGVVLTAILMRKDVDTEMAWNVFKVIWGGVAATVVVILKAWGIL